MSPTGESLYKNERWTEYTGMPGGGPNWENIIHPDDVETSKQAWLKCLSSGEVYQTEYRVKSKDGTYRWFLSRGIPQKDSRGTVLKWIGTATDIDDQKQGSETLEQKVYERTEALKVANLALIHSAKMIALGEMAGGIAHEINNPLTIISVRAELLERELDCDKYDKINCQKSITSIKSTVARIAKIISGLKTFSRNAENAPQREESVAEIFSNSLALCKERFERENISLICDNIEDATISCRAVQISQVILNLLNNAFDATQALEKKWIKIEIKNYSSHVEIRISDSGCGISPEISSKIMQPFFTTKPVGKGIGLGLSISTGIVEEHGGTLRLDPTATHTTFVMSLPTRH